MMLQTTTVLFAFIALCAVPTSAQLTFADFQSVRGLLLGNNGAFDRSTCPNEGGDLRDHWDFDGDDDCVHFPRQRGDEPLVMRLVRLAFHDSTGWIDAFVENHPFHEGLEGAFIMLDEVYEEGQSDGSISSDLGRADFYAWSYMIALERAVQRNGAQVNWDRIFFGRLSALETGGATREDSFPDSFDNANGQQTLDYFADKFEFSQRQTAVLIGAHTLGRARRDVSGFVGPWNNNDEEFDNNYYSNLLNPNCRNDRRGRDRELQVLEGGLLRVILRFIRAFLRGPGGGGIGNDDDDEETDDIPAPGDLQEGDCVGWEQVNEGTNAVPRFQWRHSCREGGGGCRDLMLNLDMGLLRDIDGFIDPVTGEVTGVPAGSGCTWPGRAVAACFPIKNEDVSDAVEEFAQNANEDDFIDEFAVVFVEMLNHVANADSLSSFAAR